MRRLHPLSCVLLLVTLATTARADEVDFAGYRLPDHHWSAWNLHGSAFSSTSHSQTEGGSDRHSWRVNSHNSLSGVLARDADDKSWELLLTQDLDGFRTSRRETNSDLNVFTSRSHDQEVSGRSLASWSATHYLLPVPVGVSYSSSFRWDWSEDGSAGSSHARYSSVEFFNSGDQHRHSHEYRTDASVGLSLGRVRDVTPVQSAWLIERRLIKTGALHQPLTHHGREALAGLFALRGRMRFAHERSERYFWREVERVLREDGALADSTLDAYSVVRAGEFTSLGLSGRAIGFTLRVFGGASARRSLDEGWFSESSSVRDTATVTSSSSGSFARRVRRDAAFVGYRLEYQLPTSIAWQHQVQQDLRYVSRDDQIDVSTFLGSRWMVAERWEVGASFTHLLQAGTVKDKGGHAWATTFGCGLAYRVEDAWSVNLSLSRRDAGVFGIRSSTTDFFLGFSRNLWGRVSAPGLIEPMRLTPVEL